MLNSDAKRFPRVAFVAGTLGLGGAERQLYYMLKVMKEANAEPAVFTLTSGEPWEVKIRDLGVPVQWFGKFQPPAARLVFLFSVLRQYRPDVIQSAHFHANPYAALAARCFRSYALGAIRTDAIGEVKRTGIGGLFCLCLAHKLVANSQQGIDNAIALGVSRERLWSLPNVVDTDIFRLPSRACSRGITILTIGRLCAQKRIDRFLSILAQVVSRIGRHIEVTGIIVGSGPLKNQLAEHAQRLRLFPNYVRFQESSEDISAVYHAADILVLTSDYEGTPNVILEAMACGLPVVAFRVGGVPEIIRHGDTGFLVDAGDKNGVADVIVNLATDCELRNRIGRRAREYVVSVHSLDKLQENLLALYNEVRQKPILNLQ